MSYSISARDYLARAEDCLQKSSNLFLFYAAFELRCGIESRIQQYLEVWDHISKKKKQGWRIASLGSASEKAFSTGDKIMKFEIFHPNSQRVRAVLYYTPVTKHLRKNAEKLGNYLHSKKKFHQDGDPWWVNIRQLVEETASHLKIATTGTLLGPALMQKKRVLMQIEMPNDKPHSILKSIWEVGEVTTTRVDYLTELPNPLEKEALVWPN